MLALTAGAQVVQPVLPARLVVTASRVQGQPPFVQWAPFLVQCLQLTLQPVLPAMLATTAAQHPVLQPPQRPYAQWAIFALKALVCLLRVI